MKLTISPQPLIAFGGAAKEFFSGLMDLERFYLPL
jgi:hypothetical protein